MFMLWNVCVMPTPFLGLNIVICRMKARWGTSPFQFWNLEWLCIIREILRDSPSEKVSLGRPRGRGREESMSPSSQGGKPALTSQDAPSQQT